MPRTIRQGSQGVYELPGGDARDAGLGEDLADVGEKSQRDTSPLIPLPDRGGEGRLRRCAQIGEGGQGAGGPVAAGDLGDGEEGTPVVSEAVEGSGWQDRLAGSQSWEIISGPTGELASE